MKKKILLLSVLISTSMLIAQITIDHPFFEKVPYRGAFGVNDWTSGWANYDPLNTAYSTPNITVDAGNISTNTTWTKNNVYLLNGFVYVTSGATLTIEAGTVIRGDKTNKGTIIVEMGGQLIANGTAAEPIVFTSNQAVGSRGYGDWGGIILLGKAPINTAGGSTTIEGGVGRAYGGIIENDNSGILKFVRVEFPGIAFELNNEINGITMCGVGSGTTIDNIQVSYSGDDSFEWFGGTVNAKHLIAYRGWDDDFDTDYGYSGMVQFGVSLRDPNIADISKSNCFESDNISTGTTASPFTSAIFSNVSSFGPKVTAATTINALYASAMHIRRSSKLKIYNSVFAGWPKGILIDGVNSQAYATAGDLKVQNTVMSGMGVDFAVGTPTTWDFAAATAWFNTAGFNNATLINNSDLKVEDPFNLTHPNFVLKSSSGLLINSSWGEISLDTLPPTDPIGLNVSNISSTELTLSWTAFIDNNSVSKYYIYQNENILIDSTTFATIITLKNLTPNTTYSFTIKAKDATGNIFASTSALTVNTLNASEYADLQVASVQLPTQIIADRKTSISATITNKGTADIVGKSWTDRIYISKDQTFNKTNANLLASLTHSGDLKKDSSYIASFQFTAPSDTLNQNRFFVETDVMDNVFELNQDNNITSSDWLKSLPNTINYADYQALCYFFNTNSGLLWNQKWNILSNRINSTNWPGVSFDEGNVTAISLPSNQIKGGIPLVLFTLSKLKDLNLFDNQLTSRIDSTVTNAMLISSFKTDSLTSINLAKNLLEGEIPSILKTFTHLKSLNLEGNRLYAISTPLPLSITYLNLQNQSLIVDSLKLSLTPSIQLPTLSFYNHSTQSFDLRPHFSLINNGSIIGSVYFNGSSYQLFTSNQFGWIYDSGQSFMLRQESGLGNGTTILFKIYFDMGDANIDQHVDILDVQHSLNNLLGDNPQPFNFSAADTYKDALITVQDIVKTVNIILASAPDTTTTNVQKTKLALSSRNRLYIEKNKLILNTEESVSAIDISLQGISEKELRLMLNNSKFQLIARNIPSFGGNRFIIFSPTGSEIEAGKTIIAELYKENVSIASANLSNKSAKVVSVLLNNDEITELESVSSLDVSVFTRSHEVIIILPTAVQKLHATLFTAQGVVLDDRLIENLYSGKFSINYSAIAKISGVYLLRISVNTKDGIRLLNTKLIISK